MKKKIREQLRWVITCIVGLFCLSLLPSTVIAASETVYPVTTEYQEINDLAGVRDNFGISGTTTWDAGWPWAQLTSERAQQVGSIYLNNKVQLDSSFSINGKLSIHFKGANKNADGIGIVFHTGEVDQIGQPGGLLGVAGLPNALAMVWDTWKNEGDPNVPYIGIWTTDSSGTKSVVNNYTTSFDITKNQELNYSFIYDANTRKVTFQAYYNISSTNDSPDYSKPIITDNSGAGYSFTIPESIKEYSFSITGSTGSTFNNQYVKVSKASIPILVTNTPKVTKEVGTTYSSVLTLSDTSGVAYPKGSTATVNGVDYTVDANSSITVPLGTTATETDLKIAVESYKVYGGKTYDAKVSESITYTRQQRFWGNVPWSFDSSTGTLTFSDGGTLSVAGDSPWGRADSLKIDATSIKKIVFKKSVNTPVNSSSLFLDLINLIDINSNMLNTSETTNMNKMFYNLNSIASLDVSSLNTSKVTNMSAMFAGCNSLASIDVSNFDTKNVTDMSYMFQHIKKTETLNVSNFDTSKVTNMEYMFLGMISLTNLNISSFDNTTMNPKMTGALSDTNVLKSITLGSKFKDTSNASQLPNITANDTYSGNWQYKTDGSIVGTTSQFLANYDGTKPGTYVWGPAKVTMTVNYLDKGDKKPIFGNALIDSTTKTAITKQVKIGEAISAQLSATDLAFDGYGTITSDSYTTGTSATQEYTTVPTKDFSITYYYTPMTKLISVPDEFSFGNFDPRDLLAKETVVYPTNKPVDNVKILNTNRTVQWVLSAKLSSAVQRDNDGLVLKGYVFYQNKDATKEKITTDSSIQLATQSTSTPLQQFVTVLGNSIDNVGIGMDIFDTQRNYLGNYTGKIDWLLTTKNI